MHRILLQPLWWRCVKCVIHHERDVRDEKHHIYVAQTYGAPFVKILYLTDLAQKLLSLAEIAISACSACLLSVNKTWSLQVQKEAQLTTSERLQVQKENALTERAR